MDLSSEGNYPLIASSKLRPFSSTAKSFKIQFFLTDIRNAKSLNIFKKLIISEKKKGKLLFSTHDSLGLKLLKRLRLECSHSKKHKFQEIRLLSAPEGHRII